MTTTPTTLRLNLTGKQVPSTRSATIITCPQSRTMLLTSSGRRVVNPSTAAS